MTTYLGKSCSFGLSRVPFVNCRQFMYLVISLLILRAVCGIWLYQFLIIVYLFTFYVAFHNGGIVAVFDCFPIILPIICRKCLLPNPDLDNISSIVSLKVSLAFFFILFTWLPCFYINIYPFQNSFVTLSFLIYLVGVYCNVIRS